MKKLVIMGIIGCLCFGVCACGEDNNRESVESSHSGPVFERPAVEASESQDRVHPGYNTGSSSVKESESSSESLESVESSEGVVESSEETEESTTESSEYIESSEESSTEEYPYYPEDPETGRPISEGPGDKILLESDLVKTDGSDWNKTMFDLSEFKASSSLTDINSLLNIEYGIHVDSAAVKSVISQLYTAKDYTSHSVESEYFAINEVETEDYNCMIKFDGKDSYVIVLVSGDAYAMFVEE